jgi:hypothetical protein
MTDVERLEDAIRRLTSIKRLASGLAKYATAAAVSKASLGHEQCRTENALMTVYTGIGTIHDELAAISPPQSWDEDEPSWPGAPVPTPTKDN